MSERPARILVVEDREEDRQLLVEYLRSLGHRLYAADNGRDGFELARVLKPDLIIMDVSMPVCDGFACCRLLKAAPATAGIPVIFLSAAVLPEERVQGLTEGAVDYINKPFNFEEVRLRVSIHLVASRSAQESQEPQEPHAGADPDMGVAAPTDRSVEAAVFRAAQRRLLSNLVDVPDLEGLARAVGTNTKRLNDAFRKYAGTTVFDYLRELRMREARRLLAETQLEIQTIASDLGYKNPANFSTAFRERFSVSPRQFRKGGACEDAGTANELIGK